MPTPERRRFRRYRMTVPISVRLGNGDAPVSSEAIDINAYGIYFTMPRALKLGMVLQFEFSLSPLIPDGGLMVNCRGRVTRVDAPDKDGTTGIAVELDTCDLLNAA